MNRHLVALGLALTLWGCARQQDAAVALPATARAQLTPEENPVAISIDIDVDPGSVHIASDGAQFFLTYVKNHSLEVAKLDSNGCLAGPTDTGLAVENDQYALTAAPSQAVVIYRQADGGATFASQNLSTGVSGIQYSDTRAVSQPALGWNGRSYLAAWSSSPNASDEAGDLVRARYLNFDGGISGFPQGLADGGTFAHPAIASTGDGGPFLVAWESQNPDSGEIQTSLVADGGAGTPVSLGAIRQALYPSVASSGREFIVVWYDDSGDPTPYLQVIWADGGPASTSPRPLAQLSRCANPVVHYDGSGYLLACTDNNNSPPSLHIFALSEDGGTVPQSEVPVALDDGQTAAPSALDTVPGVGTVAAFDYVEGGTIHVGYAWLTTAPICAVGSSSGGATTGSTGGASSSGSSGSTGGSSSGSTITGSGSTGGATSGSSGTGTSGAGTSGGTGSTGDSGNADVFGCAAGGAGLAPLALLALIGLRRRRRWMPLFAAGACVIGLAAPAHAAPRAGRADVAVLTIEAKLGVSQELADLLTTRLVAQIQTATGQAVISSSDIKNALGLEKAKTLLGCTESACMAELGGALGVDYLVTGTVAKVGAVRTFDAQIMDTAKAVVLHRYSHRLPAGADDSAFLDEVAPAVAVLFPEARGPAREASPEPKATAPVELARPSEPEGAGGEGRVLIDLLASSELTAAGGYARLRVGYWVVPSVAVVAGALATVRASPGAQLGVELQPVAFTASLRPFFSAGAQAIFQEGSSVGATASIGLAWTPVKHLVLRAEIPATYFFSAPSGSRQLYVFGGLGIGVRL